MPTSTAHRLQPNTLSATRGLPSSSEAVTSPIAWRRSGQGIDSTRREINSTAQTHHGAPRLLASFAATSFVQHETILNGAFRSSRSLMGPISDSLVKKFSSVNQSVLTVCMCKQLMYKVVISVTNGIAGVFLLRSIPRERYVEIYSKFNTKDSFFYENSCSSCPCTRCAVATPDPVLPDLSRRSSKVSYCHGCCRSDWQRWKEDE
ncbi:hypothetical protein BH10PSE16_BH10PSE16_37860 [soil metagenome]